MKKIYTILMLFIGLMVTNLAFANTEKYRLMFNDNPATGITIAWNQISGTGQTVHYGTTDFGTAFASYPSTATPFRATNFKGMNNQFVKLTGLTPNTIYYFVIRDSQGTSQRFFFKTCPSVNTEKLSIIAGGDSRSGTTQRQNSNRTVAKIRPHAVWFGGDLTNAANTAETQTWLNDWQLSITPDGQIIPLVVTYGNHENYSGDGLVYLNSLFDTQADGYFRVVFGGDLVSIYTLNSEIMPGNEVPNTTKRNQQRDWLLAQLVADNSIWKSAQYHRPIVPHEAGKTDQTAALIDWANAFYDNGVRLVVECDAHCTKITNEVKPTGVTTGNPNTWFNSTGIAVDKGITFVGEGSWGTIRPADDNHTFTKASSDFYGFNWFIIDKCKIQIRFLDSQNPNSLPQHAENDRFSISAAHEAIVWKPTAVPTGLTEIVKANPQPATPGAIAGTSTVCANSTGNTFNIASVSGADSYTWTAPAGSTITSGQGTSSISVNFGTTSGPITVTAVNQCGNSGASNQTITLNPAPAMPTVASSGANTFCSGQSVTLTSSAGSNNTWSTGATTPSITVSTAGSYSVTTSASGCNSAPSTPTTITVNPTPATPTVASSGSTTFCDGQSVTLTSSAGSGNTWSTGATTPSITVTTPGSYSVTSSASGCSSTSSASTAVTVNPAPAPPTIASSGSTTFCSGQSVTLSSSAGANNVWSTGETTPSIIVNSSGNYSVTTSASGCTSTGSIPTMVTVNPTPATPTIASSGSTTICSGQTVTLTSSAGSGNNWSTGETTPSITVSTAGSYSVATSASGCASGSSSATTVTVNPNPAPPTIASGGATTFCSGGSVTLTSSAGTNNVWSTGETTPSITVATSGNYSVTTSNAGCTSTASTPTTVTVNPAPATPTIASSGSTTICSGQTVTLTSSAGSNNVWSTGATTPSITVNSSGNYSVTTSASGCSSASSTPTTVTVIATSSAPTIASSGSTTICSGQTVTLTSSAGSGNSWSTGETTPSIVVNTAGTYTVMTSVSGCSSPSSTPITVTVNPTPVAPSITSSGSTTFCSGQSITLTSSAGSNNVWSTGESTPSITVSNAGNYSVTTSSAGCTSSASSTTAVTVNPTPATPTIASSGSNTICSGNTVTLTSSAGSANAWSTGETTQSITVNSSGSYSVTTTDLGCTSAASAPTNVSVINTSVAPTVSSSGSTTICDGQSVTLSSSGSTGNTWSTGETTPSITVTTAGTYSVSQSTSGCSTPSSTPVTVTVNPTPNTPTIAASGSTNICTGESVTLTSSASSGNVWSTGATTSSIIVNASGTYNVSSSAGGCASASSSPVTVTVTSTVAPTISTSGSTTFCSGESVVLTSSSTSGNNWSTGETTQSITLTEAGEYALYLAQGSCVSDTVTTTINVLPLPVVSLGTMPDLCVYAAPFELTSGVPSGGVYGGDGVTGGFFYPQNAGVGDGTITYNYTASNGCVGYAGVPVVVYSCLGIGENNSETIRVFPNPTDGLFTINSENESIKGYLIYDQAGRIVAKATFNESTKQQLINIQTLARGSYTLAIELVDGYYQSTIELMK